MAAIQVLFERHGYADVIRECQEVVELCLKGALRFFGIEPPPRHEVSNVLRLHVDKLPREWRDKLDEIETISSYLFEERSQAFYGDEDESIPASEIYSQEDASRAIEKSRMIVDLLSRLLKIPGKNGNS